MKPHVKDIVAKAQSIGLLSNNVVVSSCPGGTSIFSPNLEEAELIVRILRYKYKIKCSDPK